MKRLNTCIRKFLSDGLQQEKLFSTNTQTQDVPLSKCLLVSKVTRYEFEQNRNRGSSPAQLEQMIRRRGSDFEALLHYHKMQKDFEQQVSSALKELGAQVQIVNRLGYSPSLINWCDVVIPCGGDGTFLLAASRIRDSRKPVIGFNSDPSRSEGRLCLPKWCSRDIKAALNEIKEGRFRWLHRSRIRTTLASDEKLRNTVQGAPTDLHKPILPRYNVNSNGENNSSGRKYSSEEDSINWEEGDGEVARGERHNTPGIFKRLLPYLALNEVFIGENVSARVSHLQVKMDGDIRPTRTKCSGLCVSTGTGSTSWHLSINSLRTQSVVELMNIAEAEGIVAGWKDGRPTEEQAKLLAHLYNNKLVFPPDDDHLVYSVREIISADVWPSPKGLKSRGRSKTVHIKSRCVDAALVIDGGVSFPFNDGTEATLEINPDDSLKTIVLDKFV